MKSSVLSIETSVGVGDTGGPDDRFQEVLRLDGRDSDERDIASAAERRRALGQVSLTLW